LSAALLTFLLSIGDAAFLVARLRAIPVSTLALCFGLAVIYGFLKWHLFCFFLDRLNIHVTWRQSTLAFAIGEMAISLPAGDYAQNYVLRRIANVDFSISSASTTALFAVEVAVALVVLAILGIPGLDWLRPAICGFFVVVAVFVLMLIKINVVRDLAGQIVQAGPLQRVGREFIELVQGLRDLFTLKCIAIAVPIASLYLLALLVAFFLVGLAVEVPNFTFEQAMTVYLFAMAVQMLMPISSQIGVMEGVGIVAMQGWGNSINVALAAMLSFRIVWTGAIWLAGGIVVLLLWGELD